MAKISERELNCLRLLLSEHFDESVVGELLSRNNRYKVHSAYKKRALFKVPVKNGFAQFDFSSINYENLSEKKSISENVTKSKPVHIARGKGKKPVKKVTSVALDPDMFERLKLMADERGTSTGYLIRLSLKDFLENN